PTLSAVPGDALSLPTVTSPWRKVTALASGSGAATGAGSGAGRGAGMATTGAGGAAVCLGPAATETAGAPEARARPTGAKGRRGRRRLLRPSRRRSRRRISDEADQ